MLIFEGVMQTVRSTEFQVPDGWHLERYCDEDDFIVLRRLDAVEETVTVDFCRRVYGAGVGIPALTDGPRILYCGRGWRQAIVDDAINWVSGRTS
jgi:hypothetical protein